MLPSVFVSWNDSVRRGIRCFDQILTLNLARYSSTRASRYLGGPSVTFLLALNLAGSRWAEVRPHVYLQEYP